MSIRLRGLAVAAALLLHFAGGSAAAAPPKLTVNGATAADNSAVAHLKKLGPLSITLNGTPNRPFAVLLSADANDGTGGEPSILNGFFLEPWTVAPALDAPILPVFDGIGMEFIRQKLNQQGQSLAPDDFVNDVPSPLFRFDVNGKFELTGLVPQAAFLVNLTPGPGFPNPFPIDLESVGATIALYLQVVELQVPSLDVVVGNGMKVVFDPLTWSGTIEYAEGTDGTATSSLVTNRLTVSSFADPNLADGATAAPTPEPAFGAMNGGIDFWMIGLAGVQPLYAASNFPNGTNGTGSNPGDPDQAFTITQLQGQASGIEAFTGSAPSRNNENREFPFIALPGNRRLFHWCDAAALPLPKFGFAVWFGDTGEWRNLTPSPLAFDNTATVSPWECEVGVTPDGDRALVVLDRATETADRVFMLNLEPGAMFSNGLPIWEFVPQGPDTGSFARAFEESIEFLEDGAGSWSAFFNTTSVVTTLTSAYPEKMYRVDLADSGGAPRQVLPGGDAGFVTRLDRQTFVSRDRTKLMIAGGLSATEENYFCVTDVAQGSETVINVTGSAETSFTLGECNDATDGNLGTASFSQDGSQFAFSVEVPATAPRRIPRVCRTDGSFAGLTEDLILDLADGGKFDLADFPVGRDYHFSKDGEFLLFQQGIFLSVPLNDRFDVFAVEHASHVARNLTRTGKVGTQPMSLLGPWNPSPETRSTIEPCGSFESASGEYLFYFRELRGVTGFGFDRQNLIGIAIAPEPGESEPSLLIVNVTGTEFPASADLPPPPFGAPDMTAGGAGFSDSVPEYHRVRRIGGTGPYRDYMVMVGQLANVTLPQANVDQLWIFDPEQPGPATLLTGFSTSVSSPMPVAAGMRLTNPTPSRTEPKILLTVDADGASGQATSLQDLVLLDLATFAFPQRIPATAAPFSRLITGGSAQFFPSQPAAILWVSGARPRPAGFTDGAGVAADLANPTDASPFFYRSIPPATAAQLQPLTTAARAALIFGARAN